VLPHCQSKRRLLVDETDHEVVPELVDASSVELEVVALQAAEHEAIEAVARLFE
jgi:hypothetical protein